MDLVMTDSKNDPLEPKNVPQFQMTSAMSCHLGQNILVKRL